MRILEGGYVHLTKRMHSMVSQMSSSIEILPYDKEFTLLWVVSKGKNRTNEGLGERKIQD